MNLRSPLTTLTFLASAWLWPAVAEASDDVRVEEIEVEDIEVEDIEVGDIEVEEEDDDGVQEGEDEVILPDVLIRYRLQELARIGGSAHLLTEAQLEVFEQDDPHAVLLKVPGVYLRQEDGFGLRPNIGLRGASSDRSKKVTLMEDEVLFGPAPYSAPAAYYFPLMTRMQGVEVFKGPAAIRYGPNTIGGAVNFVTRAIPQKATGMLDLAYGMTNYGKLHGHFGVSNSWGGLLLEGVLLNSDGFKDLDGGGNTGFQKGEFMLKGMVQTDPLATIYHRVDLKAGYSLEGSNETYLGLTDADFEATPYRRYVASQLDRMDNDRLQLQLSYTLSVGDWFEVAVTGYRHDYYRAWRKVGRFQDGMALSDILASPDGAERAVYYAILTGEQDSYTEGESLMLGTNARTYVSQGVSLGGRLNLETGPVSHDIEFGLRVHYDEIARNHIEEVYFMEGATMVDAEEDVLTTTKNIGATLAVAGHLIYGVSGWGLTLSPGVRFEAIESTMEELLVGSLTSNTQLVGLLGFGVHYAITPELGVLAGLHQGFSPVSPGQPQEVQPERSTNYEFGLRYAHSRQSMSFEVVGFVSDYTNLIGECGFSAGCEAEQLDQQYNAGAVLVAGLEFVGGHRFDLGAEIDLPVRLSYTFTHTEFLTEFTSDNPQFQDVSVGDELPYVPAHQASLTVGVEGPWWGVNIAGTLVDAMRETAGQDGDDEAFFTGLLPLVDLAAHIRPLDEVEVYLKLDNLLMQESIVSRRPYGARPSKPFSVSLGLKLHL
ncbi:MAG: TonB-dependent receptor family protein [Myxococcota bacterium]